MILYLSQIDARAEDVGLDGLDALIALQDEIAQAIEPAGLGEVDGHEIALDGSEGSLYAYGPDAKAMLKAAIPAICRSPLIAEGQLHLRYGPVDDPAAIGETLAISDLCASRNA